MSRVVHEVEIQSTPERIYEISQDYALRYQWDPFPEKIEFLDGATALQVGTRVRVTAKSGLVMDVEYVQYSPPGVAAIKMTSGPAVLRNFAGSWQFKALANGNTRAIFKYSIRTKTWTIRLVSEPLAA